MTCMIVAAKELLSLYLLGTACTQWKMGGSFVKLLIYTLNKTSVLFFIGQFTRYNLTSCFVIMCSCILPGKAVPKMIYTVSGGMLNPTCSHKQFSINCCYQNWCFELKVQCANHLVGPDSQAELTALLSQALLLYEKCGPFVKVEGKEAGTRRESGNVERKGDKVSK